MEKCRRKLGQGAGEAGAGGADAHRPQERGTAGPGAIDDIPLFAAVERPAIPRPGKEGRKGKHPLAC